MMRSFPLMAAVALLAVAPIAGADIRPSYGESNQISPNPALPSKIKGRGSEARPAEEIVDGREREGSRVPIGFDADSKPHFTKHHEEVLDADFRRGWEIYARTHEGKSMLAKYGTDPKIEIVVTSTDMGESVLGSTEPALANIAVPTRGGPLVYVVLVNSSIKGMAFENTTPLGYRYPSDTAMLRAIQIGAEMLHVDFFMSGHKAGTHHDDVEFQERWDRFTKELDLLGFPHHD